MVLTPFKQKSESRSFVRTTQEHNSNNSRIPLNIEKCLNHLLSVWNFCTDMFIDLLVTWESGNGHLNLPNHLSPKPTLTLTSY